MGIFRPLLEAFRHNDGHKSLEPQYNALFDKAVHMRETLAEMHVEARRHAMARKEAACSRGAPTSLLALNKAGYVEDSLIRELDELAAVLMQRVSGLSEHPQGPSVVEETELHRILQFLQQFDHLADKYQEICEMKDPHARLQRFTDELREVESACKKLHEQQQREAAVKGKIEEELLGQMLLKRVYDDARPMTMDGHVLVSAITPAELEKVMHEAEELNRFGDKENSVQWRRWWRDVQVPETDDATPLKDPHINITMHLYGKKKEIHLLLKP